MNVLSAEPLNAAPEPAALLEHPVTPAERFFVRNHAAVPTHLGVVTVNGRDVSIDELRASFENVTLTATLSCAGNRRDELIRHRDIPGELPWGPSAVGTAEWTGVRLAEVLDRADLPPETRHVELIGGDDVTFGGSIPVEKAMSPEVLIAFEMNGAPLTPEHGAPVRAVVPGYIGARSVKWLTAIVARADESPIRYHRGYSLGDEVAIGEVPVNSVICSTGEPVEGFALTGNGSGIDVVEVSGDGGATWTDAELLDDLGPWAWRLWRARVEGDDLACRARDGSGATQPEHLGDVWNPKGYLNNAWHRVSRTRGR